MCDNSFLPSLVSSLFSWRCLAASTSSFPNAAMNPRHPPRPSQPIPQPLTPSLSNLPICQTPGCRSVRIGPLSLSHSVLSALHPLRFPNTIGFDSHPPFIRMSVFAHKSLLVCNVSSMLSHRVISQGRAYTRSSDGLVSYKTRWFTVRSLA